MPNSHSEALDAAALQRLGLSRPPFAETAEHGHIFSDAAYKTQINVALHMLHASEKLLVVRGETGVGKTTFLTAMAEPATPELRFCRLGAHEAASIAEVCSRFLQAMDLSAQSEDHASQFLSRLWELGGNGCKPVLLLDDAQRVDGKVLGNLVGLWEKAAQDGTPFGLVLAVNREFDGRLEHLSNEALSAEQLHIINLYPFTERQTASYLQHQLQAAGNDGKLLSTAEQRQIHSKARGVPARINAEALRLLAGKGGASRRTASAVKIPRPAIALPLKLPSRNAMAAGAAVVVLSAGLYLGMQRLGGEPAAVSEPVAAKPEPDPRFDAPFGIAMPDRYDYRARNSAARTPEPAEDEPAAQETGYQELAFEAPPADRDPAPQPAAPKAAKPEPEPELAAAPAPEMVVKTAATPPAPASAEPARAQPAPQPVGSNAWLDSRAASHYTIQLIAAHDRQALEQYVQSQQLKDVQLLHTLRDGRDWYVVVSGDYPSRAQALAALRSLPEDLRSSGAWARTFGSLHEVIASANGN